MEKGSFVRTVRIDVSSDFMDSIFQNGINLPLWGVPFWISGKTTDPLSVTLFLHGERCQFFFPVGVPNCDFHKGFQIFIKALNFGFQIGVRIFQSTFTLLTGFHFFSKCTFKVRIYICGQFFFKAHSIFIGGVSFFLNNIHNCGQNF